MSLKRSASGLLHAAMRGHAGYLSPLGRFMQRCANHISFLTHNLELAWLSQQPAASAANTWPTHLRGAFVYDFGANTGANIAYYLRQGFSVVAIEANPVLYSALQERYGKDARVTIVNCCVVPDAIRVANFFVHKRSSKLSTFAPPVDNPEDFEVVEVPAKTPSEIFEAFGEPFYVKIDLEGIDHDIVDAMSRSGIRPPYLSLESHSIRSLASLLSAGYREFKIVEGAYVHMPHFDLPATSEAPALNFPAGESAGPFGEDIPGDWIDADKIFDHLRRHGMGWKDIHARLPCNQVMTSR